MLRRFFGTAPHQVQAADQAGAALDAGAAVAGDTATVRRIVARLEQLPVDQARLVASAAYTLARAAQADLEISPEETAVIEAELQAHESLDEPTAVLVTEMAKLQARTVGGTEDYIVTREFAALASDTQRIDILRACFAVAAASGSISAEETSVLNEIAKELALAPEVVNGIRAEFHERLSSVQTVRRLAEGQ
jgi:tellurite resistance protein